jgi:homoserine dehydrogenase
VLIELIGGADFPADMMRSALRHGAQVVTANKAAIARHWDSLHACAEIGGGALRYSAAVGGGVPVLETIARLGGSVAAVEGVMNGTCNFLLSRLAEGWSFDEAVAKAQELGFAEADPSADVDGGDAADKLAILVRDAFGIALHPERIARDSLRDVSAAQVRAALERGELLKQVGRCRLLADGSIEASVRVVALPAAHPLAAPRNEENCFLVTDLAGRVHRIFGKGAGRWPTATSVFEDVMDAQRALLGRAGVADAPSAPLKLLA